MVTIKLNNRFWKCNTYWRQNPKMEAHELSVLLYILNIPRQYVPNLGFINLIQYLSLRYSLIYNFISIVIWDMYVCLDLTGNAQNHKIKIYFKLFADGQWTLDLIIPHKFINTLHSLHGLFRYRSFNVFLEAINTSWLFQL